MKKLFLFLFIISFSFLNFPQNKQVSIVTGKGTVYIPAYERQGTIYFSLRHFAEVLNLNYYHNTETEKIELKFDKNNLKITAKNPFYIETSRDYRETKVYQVPTTTYFLGDEIFIPAEYSINIIRKVSGLNLDFQKPDKIIVNDSSIEPQLAYEEKKTETPVITGSYDIYGITVDEKANGTLIRIKSKKRIAAYNSSYKDGKLRIIFRKVNVDPEKVSKSNGKGLIKEIKTNNINGDSEFIFTVGKEYSASEVLNANKGNDILITIHNKVFAREDDLEKNKQRWNFDVVVIDPGHGGKDVGAIGINGVREKDVNLGVALKLGKMIEEEMPGVKVVYTRKDDSFVELYKRGKIANENDGKLFISIHCNSTPKKPTDANGYEIYLLRPGRTKEAIDIAERENSVIKYEDNPDRYKELTDENFILVSMAHSSYMKYSEKFSELLNRQFSRDLKLASRGVKQAGFYVLVGASMPSVLIETAFLSNRNDAEYLKSKKGQEEIAESIFNAVKNFKVHYESVVNSEL